MVSVKLDKIHLNIGILNICTWRNTNPPLRIMSAGPKPKAVGSCFCLVVAVKPKQSRYVPSFQRQLLNICPPKAVFIFLVFFNSNFLLFLHFILVSVLTTG